MKPVLIAAAQWQSRSAHSPAPTPRVASREPWSAAWLAIWLATVSWVQRPAARLDIMRPTSRIRKTRTRKLRLRSERPRPSRHVMKIQSHSESHIVELEDGSR
jgi:hypothetical protein